MKEKKCTASLQATVNILLIGWLVMLSLLVFCQQVLADELIVDKACPVTFHQTNLGVLVISKPWFHASRSDAAYIAKDNATGIGVEIHFFANQHGDTRYNNVANCDRYRMLQVRKTTARLFAGEQTLQLDAPENTKEPFYDAEPLEFGRGTHKTPLDDTDKPWSGRPTRSSTVGIYDTPYVSDSYGKEGEDIWVRYETCAVCERDQTLNSILSCLSWGYEREYMGGQTGWSEPEPIAATCNYNGSEDINNVLKNNNNLNHLFN